MNKSNHSPSAEHKNRKAYNWIVYKNIDSVLLTARNLVRGSIYDFGCGEAPYKSWLLQYADKYVGVDWAESLHDTKADIVANLNAPLPIENNVADTVFSLSVLEHLCEPQTMLNEAYRILKPGGALILQVPWQWWIHEAPYDFFRYTPFGLRYLLGRAGFTEIEVKPQSGFFTMLVLKTNYFSLRLIRGPRPLRLVLRSLFSIGWYIGQKLAPHLDRLDGDWGLETTGYVVSAIKPVKEQP